jgi:retron-type reverse transcriptase
VLKAETVGRRVHWMLDRSSAPVKQLALPFAERRGEASVGASSKDIPVGAERVMERVVERGNLLAALRRVKRNGGSPGIDGMTVEELPGYLREQWPEIREALRAGTYRPQPVKRVEIPKPGGGVRKLGIPTVLDRFIQQAMLQALQPEWDRTFSDGSYGFRPGRSAHPAIAQAQRYLGEGYSWVVDLDLEKFFDRVNHDKLMSLVTQRVADRRVLQLIDRYLKAGALTDEGLEATREGTPQGGPLSPLLANLLLDGLDKELERRGHRFVRYAFECAPRRRGKEAARVTELPPGGTSDGGRPSGAGLQEQAPHHLPPQRSSAAVESVEDKAGQRACQVGTKQTNASEPLRTCRKRRNDVTTGASRSPGKRLGGDLLTAQAASGMKAA